MQLLDWSLKVAISRIEVICISNVAECRELWKDRNGF